MYLIHVRASKVGSKVRLSAVEKLFVVQLSRRQGNIAAGVVEEYQEAW